MFENFLNQEEQNEAEIGRGPSWFEDEDQLIICNVARTLLSRFGRSNLTAEVAMVADILKYHPDLTPKFPNVLDPGAPHPNPTIASENKNTRDLIAFRLLKAFYEKNQPSVSFVPNPDE